jgi:MFS transporter, DHA2 family, multidrug resistance protein
MGHGVTDAATAQRKAIAALGDIVRRQATIMAYADTFAVLGALLLLAVGLLLLTRRADAPAAVAH